jgi:hypothetical protein
MNRYSVRKYVTLRTYKGAFGYQIIKLIFISVQSFLTTLVFYFLNYDQSLRKYLIIILFWWSGALILPPMKKFLFYQEKHYSSWKIKDEERCSSFTLILKYMYDGVIKFLNGDTI